MRILWIIGDCLSFCRGQIYHLCIWRIIGKQGDSKGSLCQDGQRRDGSFYCGKPDYRTRGDTEFLQAWLSISEGNVIRYRVYIYKKQGYIELRTAKQGVVLQTISRIVIMKMRQIVSYRLSKKDSL